MGVAIRVLLVVVVGGGAKVLTEAGRRRRSGRYTGVGNREYAAKVNCHGGRRKLNISWNEKGPIQESDFSRWEMQQCV